jgi:hypothetical protein
MAHQLAFDWDTPPGTSSLGRRAAGDSRARGDGGAATSGDDGEAPGPPPTDHSTARAPEPGAVVAGASAEARLAVRRFVAVCVEVINGYRPAAHLRSLSVPGDAAGVVAQAMAATQRVAESRRSTGRATRGPSRHGRRPDPVAMHGWRLCEPRPGAVEAAVLLTTGERTWALALRLERRQQSWSATTLRLV